MVEVHTQTDTERNGDDDEHAHQEAVPLELAAVAGVLDALVNLLDALVHVVIDLFRLLDHVGDYFALLNDERVEVLEELGELLHRLLDAEKFLVAGLDVAENGLGGANAVGL